MFVEDVEDKRRRTTVGIIAGTTGIISAILIAIGIGAVIIGTLYTIFCGCAGAASGHPSSLHNGFSGVGAFTTMLWIIGAIWVIASVVIFVLLRRRK